MNTLSMFAVTGLLALAAVPAAAQTKTLTGETKTVTASVEAIDKSMREVTVKKPDGRPDVFYVPETDQAIRRVEGRRQDHREVLREPRAAAEGAGREGRSTRDRRGNTRGRSQTGRAPP